MTAGGTADTTWLAFLSSSWAEGAFVVAVLASFVALLVPTLREPLVEAYPFRQTQTAFQARIFHEEGIDLAHPKVPVLGAPFEIPFEFPLFQAAAAIVMDLGVQEDTALRVTGLMCFLATALLLYGLVRHVAGPIAAVGSLVAFVVTPFAFLWSRTSMIEYLATAGSVGLTWAIIARRETRQSRFGVLALLAGMVGMLVKPTTAVFWILPGLLYRPVNSTRTGRLRVDPWIVAAILLPIVAALLWTRHADAVKAASQTTAWLTSQNLNDWNLGTLGQRLDPETWATIAARVFTHVLGLLVIVVLAAIVAIMRSPQRLFWLGIASAALLPPFVLTNLYVVHDYYLAALTPAFAALVGLGADYVWRALPQRPGVTVAAIVAGFALVCAPFAWSVSYWGSGYANVGDAEQLALAREIDAVTSPDDYVAIVGYDWSPSVLYYAHRRGHMVVTPNESFAYDLIHDQGYRFLLVAPRVADDLGFLSRWQWLGALGPHTFALADSPTTLPSSSFISTYDRTWVDERARSAKRLESAFRLPCGHRRQIPAGVRGTWLRIADANPNTRLNALDSLVSLPVRRAVYVGPALARAGRISIACSGTRSVRVLEVVDRGPPS